MRLFVSIGNFVLNLHSSSRYLLSGTKTLDLLVQSTFLDSSVTYSRCGILAALMVSSAPVSLKVFGSMRVGRYVEV